MHAAWTPALAARLLPHPGRDGPVAAVASTAKKPSSTDVDAEVARGIAARLHERYDLRGNHPRDGRAVAALVDAWATAGGVAFATRVLARVCSERQAERPSTPGRRAPYALRRDGLPWARLRQHLAAAPAPELVEARAIAASGRGTGGAGGELPCALAYAFCVDTWVAQELPRALADGYGKLAILTALTSAQEARDALTTLLGDRGYVAPYQLVEEAPAHMPNLVATLDHDDAPLLVRAAALAWNKATRKPWLELLGCLREHAAVDAWLASV